jgi:hypothetical protein
MSFQYHIYGLQVASSRQIKLLAEQNSRKTDLTVEWTNKKEETPDINLAWERTLTNDLKKRNGISFWNSESPEGSFKKLRFDTETFYLDFLLEPNKKKLWIIYDTGETETDLDSYFVGPALGCMLRLREIGCLHASVVEIDNQAVVILGKKRGGKSTTAAGFSRLGYKILADDLAPITSNGGNFIVHPGYPKIRIRPRSAAAFYTDKQINSLPIVYSHRDSRYISLETEGGFSAKPLPLGAIYLLGENNKENANPFIEPISPTEKLIRLNENTFGNYVVTQDLRKKEFQFLSELANKIPFRRLMFGHDLKTLPLQCQAIIEDFQRLKN